VREGDVIVATYTRYFVAIDSQDLKTKPTFLRLKATLR